MRIRKNDRERRQREREEALATGTDFVRKWTRRWRRCDECGDDFAREQYWRGIKAKEVTVWGDYGSWKEKRPRPFSICDACYQKRRREGEGRPDDKRWEKDYRAALRTLGRA